MGLLKLFELDIHVVVYKSASRSKRRHTLLQYIQVGNRRTQTLANPDPHFIIFRFFHFRISIRKLKFSSGYFLHAAFEKICKLR